MARWAELGQAGLDWVGLSRARLRQVSLTGELGGQAGLGWAGLGWAACWVRLAGWSGSTGCLARLAGLLGLAYWPWTGWLGGSSWQDWPDRLDMWLWSSGAEAAQGPHGRLKRGGGIL